MPLSDPIPIVGEPGPGWASKVATALTNIENNDAIVVHTTGAETVSGAKTWTGPQYIKAVNRPRTLDSFAGVDPTLATECAAACQAALNDFSSQGGGIMELHPLGRYKIATTLVAPSNVHVDGCWGGWAGTSPPQQNGSMFVWSGATNTPMVKFQNCQFAKWTGVCLDGSSTSGCIGFQIDSNNTPRSDDIHIENYWIQKMGNPTLGQPGRGIWVAPSGVPSAYQNDRIKIGGGYIELCDTAIQISSANACDCTTIGGDEALTIDYYNKGIVIDGCGQLTIDSVTWGAMAQTPQRSITSSVATAGSKVVTVPDNSLTDTDVGATFTHPNVPALYYIAKILTSGTAELNTSVGITSGTGTAKITRGGTGILFTNVWNPVTIRNCQSESAAYGGAGTAPGLGIRILSSAGGGQAPITIQGSAWGVPHLFSQQAQIVSVGSEYAYDVMLDHDFANFVSVADTWLSTYGGGTQQAQLRRSSTGTYATPVKILGAPSEPSIGPFQILPGAQDGLVTVGNVSGLGVMIGQSGQYVTFGGKTPVASVPMAHPSTLTDVITILQNLGICS